MFQYQFVFDVSLLTKKIVQIETQIEFSLKIDSFFNVLNKTLTTCLKTNYGTRSVF